MYSEEQKKQVYKKWIESAKRVRLTEHESKVLAEIQTQARPRPKNEIRAFHKLLDDAGDY